MMKIQENNQ